jgi:putative transcriptional regulator
MQRFYRRSLLIAAALLLGAAGAMRAAEPEPAPQVDQPADPPRGYLLIAAATMQDPRFSHSVVLLLKHDDKGAFGIIINRPLAERPLAALLADSSDAGKLPDKKADKPAGKTTGKTADKAEGSIEIYFGGPVEMQRGFVVHSPDYRSAATLAVGDDIAMTATREILVDIGRHQGPQKYLFALGYTGWGAGQLEGEIARRDWFSAPADPELVFDADRSDVWERALASRSREL